MTSKTDVVIQEIDKNKNFINLNGKIFERLTVIGFAGTIKGKSHWYCKCSCGNITMPTASKLRNGSTKSCGCYIKEMRGVFHKTHGKTLSREYNIWGHIKYRCFNKNSPFYHLYGGRGITMCDRWKDSFDNFLEDMGSIPHDKYSIDRIDNNKGYFPENCRWASHKEQARNKNWNMKITFNNETKLLCDWSKTTGINQATLRNRIVRGWPIQEAFSRKIAHKKIGEVCLVGAL